jgi:proteasome lid subunit RPN8/RPN11
VKISREQWQTIVDHALTEAPNECCGYLTLTDGTVQEVVPTENTKHSQYAFDLPGSALIRANELDDEGFEIATFHSHPRSPAEPSQTDINIAFYPHWRYVIVTLMDEDPVVRCWWIKDKRSVEEEEIVVTD